MERLMHSTQQDTLLKYGFQILDLEELSFTNQILESLAHKYLQISKAKGSKYNPDVPKSEARFKGWEKEDEILKLFMHSLRPQELKQRNP